MIADARPSSRLSKILGADGNPFQLQQNRPREMQQMQFQPRRASLRYDAAQDSESMGRYWAFADHLDADSSNSRSIRQKLVSRSRYETQSNAYYQGILATQANYLVGTGPTLRMQSRTPGFNEAVEALFKQWAMEIALPAKLWCMAHAKVQDGEALALAGTNERLRSRVKLDLMLIETEQCQTPWLLAPERGQVDGIKLDGFGNPLWYDILTQHPGSDGLSLSSDAEQVPSELVMHWFRMRRPGQHRGVPEMTSSLNCGAGFRRWRDSTLTAAEVAANFAVLLQTTMAPDESDFAAPFSTAEINKGMMTALPFQYDAKQLDAKHPNSTYSEFHKSQVSEQARPLGMPYNVAAADSSSYNYASGRLDHQSYFMSLDVDREDCQARVLDKIFGLWYAEAELEYGWTRGSVPQHTWDWPQHPVADIRAEAIANNFNLRNGSVGLTQVYANQGYDAEEQMQADADLFGIPIEQYKQRVFDTLFPEQQPSAQEASDSADREEAQQQLEDSRT